MDTREEIIKILNIVRSKEISDCEIKAHAAKIIMLCNSSLKKELQEQKPTKRQGVFHVITEGNNNKIYFNGKLIEPDFKCGVPLTMEDYKKLDEIQEKYYEALEQKLPEITDEEIEKWACENTPSGPEADSVIAYKIIGAKAMRDNEIR